MGGKSSTLLFLLFANILKLGRVLVFVLPINCCRCRARILFCANCGGCLRRGGEEGLKAAENAMVKMNLIIEDIFMRVVPLPVREQVSCLGWM